MGSITPTQHAELYIPSGDIVLQVQGTLFKVHRYFLSRHSIVLSDMLDLPQGDDMTDGTDSTPLKFEGDEVKGWEVVLSSFYREDHLTRPEYSRSDLIAMLRISHKYLMENIQKEIITRLKVANDTPTFVDLMVASQIIDCDELHQEALTGIRRSPQDLTLEDVERIGLKTAFEVLMPSITNSASTISSLSSQVSSQADQISSLSTQVSSLSTLSSLSLQVSSLSTQFYTMSTSITSVSSQITSLSTQVATMSRKLPCSAHSRANCTYGCQS